ncbi:TcfC E-set like domain-containing protein [unidentified bacterial endosymbiont]|uniref:TcfC E-set like domain-containing protein n=1 Tax=unidentified bacterial endosymbiont TaxID=2355 RepID=UPI00209ED448|nr:TcfC E-set like domain-containing protein [unidentified bacterial endosymbiont]
MKKTLPGLLILSLLNGANARTDAIPPGFEAIVLGQQEYIDVYLAGHNLGKFYATVNLDTVKFEQPQKIVTAMALGNDPDRIKTVTAKLSQPLERHGELACSAINNSVGCGYLATKDVALIYNDEQNAVTLFLNKAWYPDNAQSTLYLNASRDDNIVNAFIHQQDLNVAIQDEFKSAYLQGTGALGITDNSYIGGYWSLNGNESDGETTTDADVSELYYRYDLFSRFYVQGGRMDSRSLFNLDGGNFTFSFLPLDAFDGVRAGSTLSYLNREQAGQGTPVNVLLSRSSRVDAYRDNQLLGSFYLNGGNQSLDTASFPSGSYTLQLKIYESNQLARTDVVPFTKTGSLTDGHTQWFLQAGKLADDSSSSTDYSDDGATSAQAGLRIPLTAQSEMMLGVASVDDNVSGEISGHITPTLGAFGDMDLQNGFFYNDQGGRGNMQQLNWHAENFPALSFYRKDTSGGQCSGENDAEDYDLTCFESINAGLTQTILSWSLSLNWNRTRNHADYRSRWDNDEAFDDNYFSQTSANSTSDSVQLSASRAFSLTNWMMNTNLGIFTRNESGDNDKGAYLMFSFSEIPHQDNNARSRSTTLSTDYRTSKHSKDQTSWNLSRTWYDDNVNHKEMGISLGGLNTDTLDSGVNGRIDGLYGNLSANLTDSYATQEHDHNTAFTGSYSSTLAVSRHGVQVGRAGNGDPSAAVLIDVKKMDDDTADALSVDASTNGNRASLTGDESVLFPYTGYEMGYVDVNDSTRKHQTGTTNVIMGSGKQSLMLLPGKLRYREVSATFNYNYIGRLLLPDALKHSPLIGLNSAMLLMADDGGFTLEMQGSSRDLYVLAGNTFLKCPLKVLKKRVSMRFAGDIQCSVIAYNQLPAPIQVQAQLKQAQRKQALETAQRESEQ